MSRRGVIHPEYLPPTDQAAYFHGLRVFYQVMEWRFFQDESISPQDWGWTKEGDALVWITTTAEYTPSYLQHVVSCKFKVSLNNPCSTNRCSCRKHGLPCLPSCSNCCGEDCSNVTTLTESSDLIAPDDDVLESLELSESNAFNE